MTKTMYVPVRTTDGKRMPGHDTMTGAQLAAVLMPWPVEIELEAVEVPEPAPEAGRCHYSPQTPEDEAALIAWYDDHDRRGIPTGD
jgi:hypothetical protein